MNISNIKNVVESAISTISQTVVETLSDRDKKIRTFAIIIFCCIAAVYFFSRCCKKETNVKKIDADEKPPEPAAILTPTIEPSTSPEKQEAPENIANNVHEDRLKKIADHRVEESAFVDQEKGMEAEIECKAVLKIDSSNASVKKEYDHAFFEQGTALRNQTKFPELAEKYKEALAQDLFNVTIMLLYGEILYSPGLGVSAEDVVAQFETASEMLSGDPKLLKIYKDAFEV